jgi:hypothetical protein
LNIFNINSHEKITQDQLLPHRRPLRSPRVPPRSQRAETQELVDSSQLPIQQTCIQGLPCSVIKSALLLQQTSLRYYQGTAPLNKPIDFGAWKSKIITKNLVDSVKTNFEDLSSKEYDLDKVFSDIFSKDSKAIDEIVSL